MRYTEAIQISGRATPSAEPRRAPPWRAPAPGPGRRDTCDLSPRDAAPGTVPHAGSSMRLFALTTGLVPSFVDR